MYTALGTYLCPSNTPVNKYKALGNYRLSYGEEDSMLKELHFHAVLFIAGN
jgi:hypothetical protein